MGKTRDLFKKIKDTKGTFHAKMGSIKDRNGMDLTEAEDIKKRLWPRARQLVFIREPSLCEGREEQHMAMVNVPC